MDAVEYLIQKRRLCRGRGCDSCLIEKECRMAKPDSLDIGRMVEKVEQWAKEHPVKTRQSEFLKMFPKGVLDDNGILIVLPCKVDESVKADNYEKCPVEYCSDCRRNYWLKEVE